MASDQKIVTFLCDQLNGAGPMDDPEWLFSLIETTARELPPKPKPRSEPNPLRSRSSRPKLRP